MTSTELRQSFLDFFHEKKQHTIVPSASLLPTAPNLLFTNAGMNPFVPFFLGEQQPNVAKWPGAKAALDTRCADTQKCIRAGGKHNDLEDVGFDTYHHTFFEMLGNWSFGDYFKAEAISWAWELLTGVWGLPKERLYATVYQPGEGDPAEFDQEAYDLWKAIFEKEGLDPAVHILTGNKKDNFWMMGDTGPCGPCSELHIDLTPAGDSQGRLVNADSPYCIEIWNLVFMQFAADGNGNYDPLKAKHVDTGMGFERVAGIIATTKNFTDYSSPPSNYNSDLFTDLFAVISEMCGQSYGYTMPEPEMPREAVMNDPDLRRDVIFRVLADHIRTLSFAIADGILPGNEGRNYVLRRILRRAVMLGRRLELPSGFFTRLVAPVVSKFGDQFPELRDKQQIIEKVIGNEEASFEKTLERGLDVLEGYIGWQLNPENKEDTKGTISGQAAFTLYDTYGFPLDLTQLMARERGLKVDVEGFNHCMEQQRERARAAQKKSKIEVVEGAGDLTATEFVGYGSDLAGVAATVQEVIENEDATFIVLDHTPFYAEMGGQIGDTGVLTCGDNETQILDTVKDASGRFLHKIKQADCNIKNGDVVQLTVDAERRAAIQRHHSATHILNWALRKVLGDHVMQKGSYVGPDRLRFDFDHYEAVSAEQLQQVERLVNDKLLANAPVKTFEIPYREKPADIVAAFGEKYGDTVRVVDIGGYSKELCGGCHVATAGEIGLFKIISESSISAGVRRIEALAGEAAYSLAADNFTLLQRLAAQLKCKPDDLDERFAKMVEQTKSLEKELARLKQQAAAAQGAELIKEAVERDGVKWLAAQVEVEDPGALRGLAADLAGKLGESVVVIGATFGDKVNVAAKCSPAAIKAGHKAGDLIRSLMPQLGGKGGGKPDFAMGGGTQPQALESVLKSLMSS